MVDINIDGIWCKKCKKLHPTLMWHEKYNNYELNRKEKWLENKKKRPILFQNAEYIDPINILELKEMKEINLCFICNSETYFVNINTNHYVCSDECRYKDNGYLED